MNPFSNSSLFIRDSLETSTHIGKETRHLKLTRKIAIIAMKSPCAILALFSFHLVRHIFVIWCWIMFLFAFSVVEFNNLFCNWVNSCSYQFTKKRKTYVLTDSHNFLLPIVLNHIDDVAVWNQEMNQEHIGEMQWKISLCQRQSISFFLQIPHQSIPILRTQNLHPMP